MNKWIKTFRNKHPFVHVIHNNENDNIESLESSGSMKNQFEVSHKLFYRQRARSMPNDNRSNSVNNDYISEYSHSLPKSYRRPTTSLGFSKKMSLSDGEIKKISESVSNSNISESVSNSNISESVSNSNISESVSNSNISESVSNSNISESVSNSNISESVSNSNISESVSNSNISESASNSNISE